MSSLTYIFGNTQYHIEEQPNNGTLLDIAWNTNNPLKKLWARFAFERDGSSTVTTTQVPRFFNAFTIRQAQLRYAAIIQRGVGKSAFGILRAHFDARKLKESIRNS